MTVSVRAVEGTAEVAAENDVVDDAEAAVDYVVSAARLLRHGRAGA